MNRKKESHEVDALVEKVDELANHPDSRKRMSVVKACAKVGLQPTVYYFRKRKEKATKPSMNVSSMKNRDKILEAVYENNNTKTGTNTRELLEEAKELKKRLEDIKMQIAESMIDSI